MEHSQALIIATAAIPILTTFLAVHFTHDFALIALIDLGVMVICNRLVKRITKNTIVPVKKMKVYGATERFPIYTLLITIFGAGIIFFGFHMGSILRAEVFIMQMPNMPEDIYKIAYITLLGFLMVFAVPQAESVFYYASGVGNLGRSNIYAMLIGAVGGLKGYFIIDAIYSEDNSTIAYLGVIWVLTNIFLHGSADRTSFANGHVVRQVLYELLLMATLILYTDVFHLKRFPRNVTKSHRDNAWTQLFQASNN